MIENGKFCAASYANSEITVMFWEGRQHVESVLLGGEYAKYGKGIVTSLAQ